MSTFPAVLYVEDNAQSRRLMQMMLCKKLGLKYVTIWKDSEDFAMRINHLEPCPDLIFLDIHIEPYNGFEMFRMLRQHPAFRKTPIVAMTASVMDDEIDQLRIYGFNGCIGKPFDLMKFPNDMNRLLRGEAVWRIFR